ncbi:uncharacterized protein PADG_00933 [Paracoccidioides brasiliensis Pb18]|uniref:Uncharacterized protein n=1 Tax=Paracoccidioides brasiliensis (strain Pb18) TaxID=502780 RepID=C1FYQ7_PARBD|nr:uncharacterized protein PADG_00933 [Paracoccidioides brasiliensis Pb18]EEH44644.2 hypothetical protein PADG_00933 [Paracoccidioides brasiliensis Pb18]
MADTPITWHPHTKDDPLTRLGQGTDTDILIINSTMVTPPSRLRRKHRSMLSNPRNPEAVKEVLVMAFVDMGKMQEYFRSSGYKSVDALRILPADDT